MLVGGSALFITRKFLRVPWNLPKAGLEIPPIVRGDRKTLEGTVPVATLVNDPSRYSKTIIPDCTIAMCVSVLAGSVMDEKETVVPSTV